MAKWLHLAARRRRIMSPRRTTVRNFIYSPFFQLAQLSVSDEKLRRRTSSFMRAISSSCVVLTFILACAAASHGQGLGKIVGTVRDPSGAVITNATVTAKETGKGFSRTATTDSTGYYVLDSLRPAQYDLAVEATGFHTYDQKGVTLLA